MLYAYHVTLPRPQEQTIEAMCRAANSSCDEDAGACAVELASLIEEISPSITVHQRQLLLRAGGYVVQGFRRAHPQLYTQRLNLYRASITKSLD